jgi:hypothetical protein
LSDTPAVLGHRRYCRVDPVPCPTASSGAIDIFDRYAAELVPLVVELAIVGVISLKVACKCRFCVYPGPS